jgi:hypothetical protein
MNDLTDIVHREPNYRWAVITQDSPEEWGTPEYLLVKGNGFKYTVVARTDFLEEAEEMATALNYWETRPL